ncbi:Enhancer of mRNA-decapping protein 3 [Fusarium oxysporum f. sp. raphani]|uniref:Enhancer of mRNA-decapping protein 3 n=1 Tax=Fusarium oxysporum f. sp. raphani TaxID=96318 RepID=A0A8J5Q6H5_FUSOX|nr:Enhancer of mRNA-decapping protein 3 [Fusarium oxysporum f. sp. raphani]
MATQFIGLHMRVVLRDPPGSELTGTVGNVQAGSGLTLTNVFVSDTKQWLPHLQVHAANIADLAEVKNDRPATYTPASAESIAAPFISQPPPQPAFVDPAILSLGRPPAALTPTGSDSKVPLEDGRAELQVAPMSATVSTPGRPTPDHDLTGSVSNLAINEAVQEMDNGQPIEGQAPRSAKKKNNNNRRSRQSKQGKGQRAEDDGQAIEGSPASGRGKGWRQTPILQSTSSFQPFHSLKKSSKGRKGILDNGWASEDVTEEMGEFDFENNLAKFDKRTIFDQMRKEDQIDDASRLVSHNRKPKPGTAGGKNLHYTENVLDLPSSTKKDADFWNSEADDGLNEAERLSGRDVRSGQARSPAWLIPPANEIGLTEQLMAENGGRGIAEVALIALSDPAIKVRFGLAGANPSSSATLTSPVVVILAGNNKSGIRAIAAARHLRNKNVNMLVCLVGIEREKDLLEDLRQQIQLYRAFGGKILSKADLFEHLRKASSSGSPVSVSLIIDALLGLTISFEELRTGDQAAVYELMEWANRNEAFVLSVDVPTGIDPTSGKVAVIDGSRLFVKPRYVVAMGAPKRGLLEAVTPPDEDDPQNMNNAGHEEEWRLFIADIGLGSAVWRKAGTKIRRGIDFDEKWLLEMKYRDGQQDGTDSDEE